MADVKPFRGVRYKLGKPAEASELIAPPYDIIDERMRDKLIELHPHNVVRLELPDSKNMHPDARDGYDSARIFLDEWLKEQALIRDDADSYYVLSQEFDYRGGSTRWGILASVTLEEYDRKIILPHEGTMDGPKEDRYKLMDACQANLSPIFACYYDANQAVTQAMKRAAEQSPILEAISYDGSKIRLWKIEDRDQVDFIYQAFRDKKLYIADGHHRYETCLAYRRDMLKRHRGAVTAAWNRTLMYLVDFDDPGLLIRSYHRAIRHFKGMGPREFFEALDAHFIRSKLDIDPWGEGLEQKDRAADTLFSAAQHGPAYAVIASGDDNAYLLKPKAESMHLLDALPIALRKLDVTILHKLAFEEVLEIEDEDLRAGKLLLYDSDYRVIWRAVRKKGWAAGFFISPVKPAQMSDIAEAGLKMPIKSTYFYPKIPSGLVFHRFG